MSEILPKNDLPEQEPDIGTKGSQALVHTLKVLFTCLRFVIIAVFVYMPFSGVFRLEQQQNAMLFRFGRLIEKQGEEILTPGVWYWGFPAPIDRVEKIDALKTVTLSTYSYWPRRSKISLTDANGASRKDLESLDSKQDGYLLTGDGYIMHMAFSMSYKITSPKDYFLNFQTESAAFKPQARSGVQDVLLAMLDDVILSEVSGWAVEDVLKRQRVNPETGGNETLAQAVRQRLLTELTAMSPQVGIELQEVNLLDVAPPVALSEAFNSVQTADQDQARIIQTARTYETQLMNEATAYAVQQTTLAKIEATRMVSLAKAKAENFEIIAAKYRENPTLTMQTLYTDAIREMLGACREKYRLGINAGEDDLRIMVPRVKPAENKSTEQN